MNYDTIFKNGDVATISGISKQDIAIKDGKIVNLGNLSGYDADQVIDCTSLHILPGIIDSQVHLREPGNEHKEDLHTGSMAAVAGGVTSVFEMPNTSPSTTTKEAFEDKINRAKGRMFTDHAFYIGAAADNIKDLAYLETLPGCSGVKIFMGSSTGNLLVSDDETLEKVLLSGRRRVAIHAEDEMRLIQRSNIAEEGADPKFHPEWRDVQSALLATKRIVNLSYKTKRKIHILHISTADEMEYLSKHKGGLITVEALVNHLTLWAPDCYDTLGSKSQMNPPVRTKEHNQRIWKAVNDGTVDIIATDHAPHTLEEKAKKYPKSPSGMPGVQTMVPIMLNHINQGKMTLQHFVDLCAHAPARVFGLRNKGFIRMGYDADFTIVDMNKNITLKDSYMYTKSGWTPFDGMRIKGAPIMTFIRGNKVSQEGKITSDPIGLPLEFDV